MPDGTFLDSTRVAYDALAEDYAARFTGELPGKPLDRAVIGAFAEHVRSTPALRVADVGCGPGHVTAHLRSLGLDAFGVDLSPAMVATARRLHPGVPFDEGTMTALDIADGSLGGVVALYSIIHVPDEALSGVLAEFHRVLVPGGHALVAFQVGDDWRHATEMLGHAVSLHFRRRPVERVAELLAAGGFDVRARLVREPDDDGVEKLPRAYLLARKPEAPEAPEAP